MLIHGTVLLTLGLIYTEGLKNAAKVSEHWLDSFTNWDSGKKVTIRTIV